MMSISHLGFDTIPQSLDPSRGEPTTEEDRRGSDWPRGDRWRPGPPMTTRPPREAGTALSPDVGQCPGADRPAVAVDDAHGGAVAALDAAVGADAVSARVAE